MRRPVINLEGLLGNDERNAAADSVEALVNGNGRRKAGPRVMSKANVKRAVDEARAMAQANQLSKATPKSMVALYYLCHTEVYGAEPGELVGETWRQACMAAGRLLKTEFTSDTAAIIEFIRWVWRREKWREQHRQDGANRWRVTWRQQFVRRDLLSDYRTELARKARSIRAGRRK